MVYRGLGDGTGELTEFGRELYQTEKELCEVLVHNAQYELRRQYPGIYTHKVAPPKALPPRKTSVAAPKIDAEATALSTLKGMGMALEDVFGPKSKGGVANGMGLQNPAFYAALRKVAVKQGLLRR